jgi:HEPN domain-containing protein
LTNKSLDNDFYDFLEYQLPIFDQILAESQKPLPQRPLAAACYFVNYCIVEIEGEDKEAFLEKQWFKSIYKLIKKWYKERYADAMNHSGESFALGVVLIYDTPFKMRIPLSIAEEKESDDKRWFCFPSSVLESDNVLEWIINKPNLDRMTKDDLDFLREVACKISSSSRAIHINLMTATLENDLHRISSSIPAHLDKAVQDILSMKDARISTSYWEVHLAVEKAIKLIILQNGRDHQNKHNLNKLCSIANNIKGISLDCCILSQLPSDNEAIQQRYGEGRSFTIQEAVKNYAYACEVISRLTEVLKREFVFKNARFLIAVPPWEK